MPLSDAGLAIIYNKLMEVIKLLEGRTALDTGFLSDKKSLAQWQLEIHELAIEKGWWSELANDQVPRNSLIANKLLLIHSEISEAVEELRESSVTTPTMFEYENGKPIGFLIELADTVIRILDLCGALNINIEEAIRVKHEYNKTRSHRHGGKAL